jgi:hypothetical protein
MFQFPGYASAHPMNSGEGDCQLRQPGSPIRTSPDRRLLTAPRGISLFATSFFGSWRLGILRVLLLAYPELRNQKVASLYEQLRTCLDVYALLLRYPVFKEQSECPTPTVLPGSPKSNRNKLQRLSSLFGVT